MKLSEVAYMVMFADNVCRACNLRRHVSSDQLLHTIKARLRKWTMSGFSFDMDNKVICRDASSRKAKKRRIAAFTELC